MKLKNIFLLPLLIITCTGIAQTAQIAGKIQTPIGTDMSNVSVELIAPDGSSQTESTNADGSYAFTAETGITYSINISFDQEPLAGVSTLDIVRGMQHIVHLQSFSSPYEFIAADVNNSGGVTVADIWQMRQMILGFQTEWMQPNWFFVPADFDFDDGIDTPIPSVLRQIEHLGDTLEVDFIGVKMGDITGNSYE